MKKKDLPINSHHIIVAHRLHVAAPSCSANLRFPPQLQNQSNATYMFHWKRNFTHKLTYTYAKQRQTHQCKDVMKSNPEWLPTPISYNLQYLLIRLCVSMDISPEPVHARKCRRPRAQEQSYASLRNQNAHGHLTKTLLWENLQEKCCAPKRAPWSNPAL